MSVRCPWHHGPVSACPDPDLSDVLDDLREHVVPSDTLPLLGDCGGCEDDVDVSDFDAPKVVAAAVARVAIAGVGFEDACTLHLGPVFRWWRRRYSTRAATVLVPACALTESVVAA